MIKNGVAIVTGAGQGLGRATAVHLSKLGAKVGLIDVSETFLNETVEIIGIDNAIPLIADVTNEKEISEAISKTLHKFGKINYSINCAGIAIASRTVSKKGAHDLAQFTKVIHVNTIGTFNVVRLVAEAMSKNEPDADNIRGVIINTASIAAMDGQIGQAAYAASKGAVVSMTLPIARDLSTLGIRVCSIAPGLFLTPMLEKLPVQVQNELASTVLLPKRLGNPNEYAMLVQSIIENPMMNGEVVRLDGGLRMQP